MVLFKGMGTKRPNYSDEKAIVDLGGLPSGDIANYQAFLAQNGYTPQEVQGFAQGLNSGNQGIQNWIDNYNTENVNNPILQPKTEEEVALARQGQFNVAQPQESQELTAAKQSLFNKFVNGMTDLANGYQENRNTAYSPENLRPNGNENFMTRLGEVAGTGARFANSPAGQAIIAGILTKVVGGGTGQALTNAYNYGSNRVKTNAYADELNKLGINYTPSFLSNLTSSDANAMATPVYKQWENEVAKQKLEENIRYHDLMNQIYLDRLEEQKNYHNGTLADKKEKNNISREKNSISKERNSIYKEKVKQGGKKTTKPQEHPEWNSDLAQTTKILSSEKISSKNKEKVIQDFMDIHGVDPRNYIAKDKNETSSRANRYD